MITIYAMSMLFNLCSTESEVFGEFLKELKCSLEHYKSVGITALHHTQTASSPGYYIHILLLLPSPAHVSIDSKHHSTRLTGV